jgi:uncharacterized delta-60 repeat protein
MIHLCFNYQTMKNLIFFISTLHFTIASAQIEFHPDSLFGINGIMTTEVGISSSGESGMGNRTLKMLPDGKMLLGTTAKIDDSNANRNYWISRTLSDGAPDGSFGDNGKVIIFSGNDGVGNALTTLDTDEQGAVYVLGERKDPFTVIEEAVVKKLASDGSTDNGFGTGGETVFRISPIGSFTRARDLKVLANGQILVLMDTRFSTTSPVGLGTEYCVAKLKTDGNLDSTFGVNGLSYVVDNTLNDLASKMVIQSDGKIVLAGTVSVSGIVKYRFIRLNEAGSLDASFGSGGSIIIERDNQSAVLLNDLILDQNDAIYATGNAAQILTVVKLNANGSLDISFSGDGILDIGAVDVGNKLIIDDEGLIYAIGREFNQIMLAVFNNSGQMQNNYGIQGVCSMINPSISSSDLTAAKSATGELFIAGKSIVENNDFYSLMKVKFVDTSSPTIISEVSNKLSVFPNPTSNALRISLPTAGEISICIISSTGQIVNQFNTTNREIQTRELTEGLYFMRIESKGKIYQKSFLKTN